MFLTNAIEEADRALIVAAVNDYDRLRAIEEAARAFIDADDRGLHNEHWAYPTNEWDALAAALAVKLREEG